MAWTLAQIFFLWQVTIHTAKALWFAGTSWPVPLDPSVEAELRLRCSHIGRGVLPRYGLNIFRFLSFLKKSEQSNCAFETKHESGEKPKSLAKRARSGQKGKAALKKAISGPMFKALVTTCAIAQGEEILLPVTDLDALANGAM